VIPIKKHSLVLRLSLSEELRSSSRSQDTQKRSLLSQAVPFPIPFNLRARPPSFKIFFSSTKNQYYLIPSLFYLFSLPISDIEDKPLFPTYRSGISSP